MLNWNCVSCCISGGKPLPTLQCNALGKKHVCINMFVFGVAPPGVQNSQGRKCFVQTERNPIFHFQSVWFSESHCKMHLVTVNTISGTKWSGEVSMRYFFANNKNILTTFDDKAPRKHRGGRHGGRHGGRQKKIGKKKIFLRRVPNLARTRKRVPNLVRQLVMGVG